MQDQADKAADHRSVDQAARDAGDDAEEAVLIRAALKGLAPAG